MPVITIHNLHRTPGFWPSKQGCETHLALLRTQASSLLLKASRPVLTEGPSPAVLSPYVALPTDFQTGATLTLLRFPLQIYLLIEALLSYWLKIITILPAYHSYSASLLNLSVCCTDPFGYCGSISPMRALCLFWFALSPIPFPATIPSIQQVLNSC